MASYIINDSDVQGILNALSVKYEQGPYDKEGNKNISGNEIIDLIKALKTGSSTSDTYNYSFYVYDVLLQNESNKQIFGQNGGNEYPYNIGGGKDDERAPTDEEEIKGITEVHIISDISQISGDGLYFVAGE